jgi:Flp pilus assembly secretin CpaC
MIATHGIRTIARIARVFLLVAFFGVAVVVAQAPEGNFDDRRITVPGWSDGSISEQIPSPKAASRTFTNQQSVEQHREEEFLQKIEFSDAPIAQVIKLFANESGLKIVLSERLRKNNPSVTISIRDMYAVAALKELTRQTGTFFKLDTSSGYYTIYDSGERDPNTWDSDSLRQFEKEINESFPDSIVKLSTVGRQLIVKGQAHDVVEASRIIRLVDAEARGRKVKTDEDSVQTSTEITRGGGLLGGMQYLQRSQRELTVIDMLTVTGDQQVSLRVTVAEVDRNAARQIGLNFGIKGNEPNGPSIFQNLTGTSNDAAVGSAVVSGGNLPTMLDNGQIQLAINALRQMSLAKTLAEPTLTSLNGQEASFHAGGQFPIPIVSGQTVGGLQGVSFVPFGVSLKFTPYITDRDRVRLRVMAEVSNRANGDPTSVGGDAASGGTLVPGLDMRKFETIVELREGQTLAVAGLISHNQVNLADRVPFFGDLPVVGRLAALDRISSREQELVILVTPELVRALEPHELPDLPGSDVFEPGDVEFYLGGLMEGNRNENFRSSARTDIHRQKRFYEHRDIFIVGPHGYTECGPGGSR